MKKVTALLLGVLASVFVANAVPAKKGLFTFTQPDGTNIGLQMRGSHFSHYYLTDDNVPVLRDADGWFRYAGTDALGNIELSPMPATGALTRTAEGSAFVQSISTTAFLRSMDQRLQQRTARNRVAAQSGLGLFTGNYPRTGNVRTLVFLVEYRDVKFSIDDPAEFFDRLLNEEGFSSYGATGSARDYFKDQSLGQFDVHFDVCGPVTLNQNRRYYGANDMWGNDQNPEAMVSEAARKLDVDLDFSEYDYDDDGYVDNIFVIYAGVGEASSSISEAVWPHSWALPEPLEVDGKLISGYACSNEIDIDGTPTGIGTPVHEFSHVMGLPDLYSTQSSLACTPGEWSVLDYGPYNNNGRTPPSFGAFERNAMGWMEPMVLTGPETVVLEPVNKSNAACLIPTEKETEFFLLENRQKEGWDKYLPYHGMLIWHIDFNQEVWDSNKVNNIASHQYVDIEEANNNPNSNSDAALKGYPFPGTERVRTFTADTKPAMRSWSNKAIELPLTNIQETADGIITFDVAGGRLEVEVPEAPEVVANENGTLSVTWKHVTPVSDYLLSVFTHNDAGDRVYFRDYNDFSTGYTNEYLVEGVEGETEYFVTLKAVYNRNYSEESAETSVTTPVISMKYIVPTALRGDSYEDNVTFSWLPVKNAAKYLLTLEAETEDGEGTTTIDFADKNGEETIPEGWEWTGGANDFYRSGSTGYFGTSAPALKFATNGATLTSPVMERLITKVSFWVRGANSNSKCNMNVEGRYDEEDAWTTVHTINPMSSVNTRGVIREFEPNGNVRQIRFVYTKAAGSGNASVDDIVLTMPASRFDELVGFARHDVGNVTEYSAEIPDAPGRVRFYIQAVDADGVVSQPSNAVVVSLKTVDGIAGTSAAASSLTLSGRTLFYSGAPGTVRVVTAAGVLVTELEASAGSAAVSLQPGFYIATSPAGVQKLVVK